MMPRVEHLPSCTDVVGGDCDCGPMPAEVWCEQCPGEAHYVVSTTTGDHALCRDHALTLQWKIGNTGWNPGIGMRP